MLSIVGSGASQGTRVTLKQGEYQTSQSDVIRISNSMLSKVGRATQRMRDSHSDKESQIGATITSKCCFVLCLHQDVYAPKQHEVEAFGPN